MNTAQVTSGLKLPLGFGAGVGIQPGRWIPLLFHRICFFKCLVMPWELWPPGQTGPSATEGPGVGFLVNALSMTKRKFGSFSLEKLRV